MISLLIQAILSGICISIAATVFLSVGGGVIGSLLFSMGLLIILSFQFKLYTGAIGYVSTKKDILDMINQDTDEEENTVEDDELDEFVEDNNEEDNFTLSSAFSCMGY